MVGIVEKGLSLLGIIQISLQGILMGIILRLKNYLLIGLMRIMLGCLGLRLMVR